MIATLGIIKFNFKFFDKNLLKYNEGIDYGIKKIEIDGYAMKLQIWDTAG
jgi:hypothetical protein